MVSFTWRILVCRCAKEVNINLWFVSIFCLFWLRTDFWRLESLTQAFFIFSLNEEECVWNSLSTGWFWILQECAKEENTTSSLDNKFNCTPACLENQYLKEPSSLITSGEDRGRPLSVSLKCHFNSAFMLKEIKYSSRDLPKALQVVFLPCTSSTCTSLKNGVRNC